MSTQFRPLVNELLTGVSQKLVPVGMVAEQILPDIKAAQYTGSLGRYGNGHLRIVQSIKGGKGRYRQVEAVTRDTFDFQIDGHGLTDLVTKEDYRNVKDPFKAEADVTEALSMILQIEKEKALADTLGNTAVITQNVTLAGTDQYNSYLDSDPIGDFLAAKLAVRAGCGFAPNAAAMDWAVAETLRTHPQLLEALGFKENRPGGLVDSELAKVLGVQKLFIAQGVYNSAQEGQTDVIAPIWGKNIIFMVSPDKAAPNQTALGYHVTLEGEGPRKVYSQAMFNPPGATELLVEDNYDQLISNANAAYLIKNAIA